MEAERLLAEAEVRAERITAIVRLVVGAVLGTLLYVLMIRSPLSENPMFERQIAVAVPTVGLYVALGVASYLLAVPRQYRPWMPWAFTTCDIAFLLCNLFIAVENLELPSSYVAIIPTIWVAPLFFAVALLRYNPRLQAYVVLATSAGVVAFILLGPTERQLSETAAAYWLENLVGGAPAIGRVATLAVAGLILVLAAARARRLLRRAVNETVRRANLVRYLPAQIADRLAESGLDAARTGRQHDVAVLFADIRGFTERAETMEPAALSRFVAEFRRLMTQAAHAHGGIVDKFIGDNAMIVFGVPDSHPDDARNALLCARTIFASVGEWNAARSASGESPVRIGVGAHWGRVFSGAVGDDARLEFTVLGDTVNVAARLEEATKRAGLPLLVSEDLLRAGGSDPADGWVALPEAPLRGRHGVVRIYGRAEGVQISA
jgi:adenylate cyclase